MSIATVCSDMFNTARTVREDTSIMEPVFGDNSNLLEGCPHFRGQNVHNMIFEDSNSVLFIKVP